jgi:hypothetical protein
VQWLRLHQAAGPEGVSYSIFSWARVTHWDPRGFLHTVSGQWFSLNKAFPLRPLPFRVTTI